MNFQYKVRDSQGKLISGFEEASSRASLAKNLEDRGLHPVAIIPVSDRVRLHEIPKPMSGNVVSRLLKSRSILHYRIGKLVKDTDLLLFTRDLLSLVHSGVSLVLGIRDISSQIKNLYFRDILEKVSDDINRGNKLSEAFEKHPKIFSEFFCNSIRSGEEAGRLEEVLERLSNTMERDIETTLTVKNAIRYPIIVLCFLGVAFTIMVSFVIPRFANLFHRFNTPLPLPTRILIALGNFFHDYGYLVLFMLVVFPIFIALFKKTTYGARVWDSLKLHIPVFGTLYKKMILQRFVATLQTLYASGIVLPDALETSSRVVDNRIMAEAIRKTGASVRQGKSLFESLRENNLFPPLVIRVIMMGEKTGNLERMLGEVIQHYGREILYITKNLTTLIEPILIVILGVMILIFALGVFLPMWSFMQLFRH
ncbi:MAG: type II secretion system F family protein [Candidatus Omnitrophica bacterium]|nr:type II secretion system F family protein [Candidatus Omnitrophota bacterium]